MFPNRKPLNNLENPIYPDIRKDIARFQSAGKHWDVDVGRTILETESFTQFLDGAILTQSRDHQRNTYGVSSDRVIVNAEFRPPLISYYEDIGPLSRVPATINGITESHINPGTVHSGGTSSFTPMVTKQDHVRGALTDRIKNAQSECQTFYFPICTTDVVLPDLELNMPSASADSQQYHPVITDESLEPYVPVRLVDRPIASVTSGVKSNVHITGSTDGLVDTAGHTKDMLSVSVTSNPEYQYKCDNTPKSANIRSRLQAYRRAQSAFANRPPKDPMMGVRDRYVTATNSLR